MGSSGPHCTDPPAGVHLIWGSALGVWVAGAGVGSEWTRHSEEAINRGRARVMTQWVEWSTIKYNGIQQLGEGELCACAPVFAGTHVTVWSRQVWLSKRSWARPSVKGRD